MVASGVIRGRDHHLHRRAMEQRFGILNGVYGFTSDDIDGIRRGLKARAARAPRCQELGAGPRAAGQQVVIAWR